MSTPDILASKRTGFRLGRVKISFKGRMSQWKKGTRVKIWSDGKTLTIERVKWTGSLVPLAHRCYAVQRRLIEFDTKRGDYCEVPIRKQFGATTMRTFEPCGKRAIAKQRGERRCEFHYKP